MKRYIGGACAAALIGGSAFAHAATAAPAKAVQIKSFAFHAKTITVKAGTRVTWTNKDGDPHTVKSVKGRFASGALDTGKSYGVVLKKKGTFSYYCTIHPYMKGTVVVK
jgi:plastocyanin